MAGLWVYDNPVMILQEPIVKNPIHTVWVCRRDCAHRTQAASTLAYMAMWLRGDAVAVCDNTTMILQESNESFRQSSSQQNEFSVLAIWLFDPLGAEERKHARVCITPHRVRKGVFINTIGRYGRGLAQFCMMCLLRYNYFYCFGVGLLATRHAPSNQFRSNNSVTETTRTMHDIPATSQTTMHDACFPGR